MITFEEFVKKHSDEIDKIKLFTCRPISDEAPIMDEELCTANGYFGRLSYLLPLAEYYLDIAEKDKLPIKSKDYTDYDREITLRCLCANERLFRDIIRGQLEACDKRISSIQSKVKGFMKGV